MINFATIIAACLIATGTAQALGLKAMKLGRADLIGRISRINHQYNLHLDQPISVEGESRPVTDVHLVDTQFKKLAELDTMTTAQIGDGRWGLLGTLRKRDTGLILEVIKCKPLDL